MISLWYYGGYYTGSLLVKTKTKTKQKNKTKKPYIYNAWLILIVETPALRRL